MSGLRSCLPLIDFDPAVGTYDSNNRLTSLRNTGLLSVPYIVINSTDLTQGYFLRYVKGNPAWQFVNIGATSLAFDLRPGIGQPQTANANSTQLLNDLWNGDRGISTFCVATEYDPTITNQRFIYSGLPQSGSGFSISGFSTPTSKSVLGAPVASLGALIQHAPCPIGTTYILSGSSQAEFSGNTLFFTVDAEYCNAIGYFAQGLFTRVIPSTQVDRPVGVLIGGNFVANFTNNSYPGLILRVIITPWLDKTKRLQVVEELKQIYF